MGGSVPPLCLMSVLPSIISLVGSLVGARANQDSQHQAQQYNQHMAQYQNQENLAQWNRENAYNDPSAQMDRLKKAGLNPDLMYGNGSASTGMSAQLSGNMTGGAPTSPLDYSALALNAAQIGKLSAETAQIKAQTRNIDSSTALNDNELSWADVLKQSNFDLTQGQIRQIDQNIKEIASRVDLNNINKDFLEKSLDDRLQAIKNENNLTTEQINIARNTIDEIKQRVINLKKEGRLTEETIRNVIQDTTNKKLQEGVLSIEKDLEYQKYLGNERHNRMTGSKDDPTKYNAYGYFADVVGVIGQIFSGAFSYGQVKK